MPERIRLEIDRRTARRPPRPRRLQLDGLRAASRQQLEPVDLLQLADRCAAGGARRTAPRARGPPDLRCLDAFLNGYPEDGGCDEGPSYWGRAGASLFDGLELLHEATGGALDMPSDRRWCARSAATFAARHIAGEWYTNFADAPARVFPNGDLVYRYGRRTQR